MRRLLVSAAGFLLVGVGALLAQTNTTPATAANAPWGQRFLSTENGQNSQVWFFVHVETPRSYCVETGQPESGGFGDKKVDTIITVYRADATTVITTNDDGDGQEPVVHLLSRACWIPPQGNTDNFVKVTPFNSSDPSTITVRFLETTMYCPWFFVAGDYNAFSLLRNTSKTALAGVIVTWRGTNGAVAGTTTVTVPGNGSIILSARDFVDPGVFSNGSIEIAHTGSPQQLIGSTTTLSGTTGLGFDALFEQRKTW